MDKEQTNSISELEKIFLIFSDFMTRVTKFEELVDMGSRLLFGFQQGLVFLRKPPIDKASKLVESIIKANATRRLSSYVEAGFVNAHDRVQNMNKLHSCQVGLLKNLSTAKDVVGELESLVKDASVELKNAGQSSPYSHNWDTNHEMDSEATIYSKDMASSDLQRPEITDYSVMMAVIYSMVKQDYVMQRKIISALNLNSSFEELESYCLMWSLRPFINDEVMHQAWSLIP